MQLASSRERTGLLLDRAARVVAERLERASRDGERLAARLAHPLPERLAADGRRLELLGVRAPRVVASRLAAARTAVNSTAASLAVLGPQATLERGYAIVRAGPDGAILRDPAAAPPGTALNLSLAGGVLAATSDGPRAPAAVDPRP